MNNNSLVDSYSNDPKNTNDCPEHIASEQKRRQTLRDKFKELSDLVPSLRNVRSKSEAVIIQKSMYLVFIHLVFDCF